MARLDLNRDDVRQRALAAIEVGQKTAGHEPSAEAMARAEEILAGRDNDGAPA